MYGGKLTHLITNILILLHINGAGGRRLSLHDPHVRHLTLLLLLLSLELSGVHLRLLLLIRELIHHIGLLRHEAHLLLLHHHGLHGLHAHAATHLHWVHAHQVVFRHLIFILLLLSLLRLLRLLLLVHLLHIYCLLLLLLWLSLDIIVPTHTTK